MAVFQSVIMKCVELLNMNLTFSPYSFTFGQAFLALACLGIVISFISRLFDR